MESINTLYAHATIIWLLLKIEQHMHNGEQERVRWSQYFGESF